MVLPFIDTHFLVVTSVNGKIQSVSLWTSHTTFILWTGWNSYRKIGSELSVPQKNKLDIISISTWYLNKNWLVKKHSDLTKSGKTVTLNNLLELYCYMGRNIPGNFVIEDKVMFGFIFPTLRGSFLFQTNLTEVVAEMTPSVTFSTATKNYVGDFYMSVDQCSCLWYASYLHYGLARTYAE